MTPAKGFAEMKGCGIEWIGEIPATWDVFPAGGVFDEVKEKNVNNQYSNPFSFRYGEIVDKKIAGEIDESVEETLSAYRVVSPNTIMINGLNLNYDFISQRVAIVREKGIITSAYLAVQPDEGRIVPRFVLYLLKAYDYRQVFHGIGSGIRKTLKFQDFKSIKIVAPSLTEQSAIASYLDTQCAKIDEIIAQAKASIEDYKQWKASIIYEAVTKGLDPNVEMKDSGIEWISLLPATVKVSRVGMHFSITLGKMLCPKPLDDTYSLEPYFCAANVHFSGVDTENLKEMWFNSDEKERYRVAPGDLLVVEGGAGAGGCAVIEAVDFPVYIQNSIMIVRPKRKNNVKYLKYFIEALVGRGYVDFACNKATIPHFTKEKLSAVPFPVFDGETQGRIVDFLDSKCGRIDDLIFHKQFLIEDLESYKKSLIYEVVTGKRSVRQ